MNGWETEDDFAMAAQAVLPRLPSPYDTPYRTPSVRSRRSSNRSGSFRKKSTSPAPSSSPPPVPEMKRESSRDIANDERISILDPRRFTPTLHANLVAEILSLRRDSEEKTKVIEALESELHETRGEQEALDASTAAVEKENRSLKRQLALLEGGTSSALSELAKERDEAVETAGEIRKRLDSAQKKIRSQEEEADRAQTLWASDKDNWEEEKRKYECKIHIAESRLMSVLNEVAAFQNSHDADQDEKEADQGHGTSDAGSIRSMSLSNSIRFSLLSGPNGYGAAKANGPSLADELDFDTEEDQTDYEGRDSVMSIRESPSPRKRDSTRSRTHRRNQSSESIFRPGSVARGRLLANQTALDRLRGGILEADESESKHDYVDTGIQFSPPPSPQLVPVQVVVAMSPESAQGANEHFKGRLSNGQPAREWEVEANQRRKRVHPQASFSYEATAAPQSMVSTGSQTLDVPLSPPTTPLSATRSPSPPPLTDLSEQDVGRTTNSMSTQTDFAEVCPMPSFKQHIPLLIPSIQLHPPSSAPPSPGHESLLPQHSKNAACQAAMPSRPTKSSSMQTEEIRVDTRLNFLPPHLQPSALVALPPSPEYGSSKRGYSPSPSLGELPPRNPRRMVSNGSNVSRSSTISIPSSPPLPATQNTYPGNNDDGGLAKDTGAIRRPPRISSLFAGFSSDDNDGEDFKDADLSETDFRTALSAPKPVSRRASERTERAPVSSPESVSRSSPVPRKSAMRPSLDDGADDEDEALLPTRQLGKPWAGPWATPSSTNFKDGTMRRAALIQSGVAAHQGRHQSPGAQEKNAPPLPIPARVSSRRPSPWAASEPGDGRASPSYGRGLVRGPSRSNSIRKDPRKVRSAVPIARTGRTTTRRQGSRSPPPMSPSTEDPGSPQYPPMPQNELTYPGYSRDTASSRYRTHRQQSSAANTAYTMNTTNTINTDTTHFENDNSQTANSPTSVVDAIAQTMVGEWMFKYVRRRKSFGVADPNIDDNANGSGVRHRRWVWLAPYERAVMWSSKQPTSGTALLGKTGRKLTIQSVLDVKDDAPPPKGLPEIFNRSILILTPARALKFTAVSQERHYIWLTALSFLAHSTQEVPPEIVSPKQLAPSRQILPQIPNFAPPSSRPKKMRDSIRIAKGKTAAARPGPISVQSTGNVSIRDSDSFFAVDLGTADTAEPPTVPRFTDRDRDRDRSGHGLSPLSHSRKRSNTGSRVPPPLSFRGLGFAERGHAPQLSTAGLSVSTNGSDNFASQSSSVGGNLSGPSSARTSDASRSNNFFDAVGTMRMEAFISPLAPSQMDDYPDEMEERRMDQREIQRRKSRERRRRSRNKDTYYGGRRGVGMDDKYGGSKTAGEEEYGNFDPFKGF